jgi:hypothetical protein
MKQSTLDRRVAQATGESVRLIRQRGFSLLVRPSSDGEKSLNLENKASLRSQRPAVLASV